MRDSISDAIMSAVFDALFGSPTRAGFSVSILGPVLAVLVGGFGGSLWLAVLVWVLTGLAAGALIAVRGRGREGLLTALIVPIALLVLFGLLGGASVAASRGGSELMVTVVEAIALMAVPNGAGYVLGRLALDRIGPGSP